MYSLWEHASEKQSFKKLNKDINTDVLIIGGGIAGILCANELKNAGIDYILTEAETIGNGITKNTTAKITSQHGLIYDKIIKKYGEEKARMYLEANNDALKKYSEMCKNIDCDFEIKDSYVYSLTDRQKIEAEIKALYKLGFNAKFEKELSIPLSVAGAVRFKSQAQFNPMMFLYAIAKDLNIFEKTKVERIEGTTAFTNKHKIKAQRIIVATHFPFLNRHGAYFIKMYQHRSYVIALENAQDVNGMYVDEAQKGMSFRNHNNLLLIGGGDHRTGKKGGAWKELRAFAEKAYPQSIEKYYWATQDCMTLDGIPYIGQYSPKTPDLFVATGFNKWGMTSAMASAIILRDLVQGKKNDYASVFSPSRSILHPQLFLNAGETVLDYIYPTTKRCPHLGCALKWNPYERTWDCPCHGSRFTKNGKLIDNPATGDLNK